MPESSMTIQLAKVQLDEVLLNYKSQYDARQANPCTREQAQRFIDHHKSDIVKKVSDITSQMLFASLYVDMQEKSVIIAFVSKAITVTEKLQVLLTSPQEEFLRIA